MSVNADKLCAELRAELPTFAGRSPSTTQGPASPVSVWVQRGPAEWERVDFQEAPSPADAQRAREIVEAHNPALTLTQKLAGAGYTPAQAALILKGSDSWASTTIQEKVVANALINGAGAAILAAWRAP